MHIIDAKAENYSLKYTSALPDTAKEIEIFTNSHHAHAHMCSGHFQGKALELFSKMLQPKYILEIGTFTGFSAVCLAKGLQQDGELHTIELREEDAKTASGFFQKDENARKIFLHTGDAKDIIPTLDRLWDLVFIDADKVSYIDYYELTLPRLRSGGFILADNVLFHGEVLEDNIKGKNAVAIQKFNDHVQADSRTENVLLTIRDGLLLIRKNG